MPSRTRALPPVADGANSAPTSPRIACVPLASLGGALGASFFALGGTASSPPFGGSGAGGRGSSHAQSVLARRAQLERENEAGVLARVQHKKERSQRHAERKQRAARQAAWLRALGCAAWLSATRARFEEQRDGRALGRLIVRQVGGRKAASAIALDERARIACSRLSWVLRLQIRVWVRIAHARTVRSTLRAGLLGPEPPTAAAAASAAAEETGTPVRNAQMLRWVAALAVARLRRNIVAAQRLVRDFLACKKARLASMYLMHVQTRQRHNRMAEAALKDSKEADRQRARDLAAQRAAQRSAGTPISSSSSTPSSSCSSDESLASAAATALQINTIEQKLGKLKCLVLSSVQRMETLLGLNHVPLEDMPSVGGTAGRRASQCNLIGAMEENLAQRRAEHMEWASLQHRDALDQYESALEGCAKVDKATMSTILQMSCTFCSSLSCAEARSPATALASCD